MATKPLCLKYYRIKTYKHLQTPLIGYHINSSGAEFGITWQINGDYSVCTNENDIIGMWEEPHPRVPLDLPCPLLNPTEGQEVWYFSSGNEILVREYDNSAALNKALLAGRLFGTESDAQEWLDAMRNARR